MVAAACGASDEALGGGGAGGGFVEQQVGAAEDMSAVDKLINWSNWPLYIDIDDETGVASEPRGVPEADRLRGRLHRGRQRQQRVLREGAHPARAGPGHRPRHRRPDGLDGRAVDPERLRPEAQQGPDPQLDQPAAQVLLRGVRPGPPVLAAVAVGLRRARVEQGRAAGDDRHRHDDLGRPAVRPGPQGPRVGALRDARHHGHPDGLPGRRPVELHRRRVQRRHRAAHAAGRQRPDPPGHGQRLRGRARVRRPHRRHRLVRRHDPAGRGLRRRAAGDRAARSGPTT